WGGEGEGFVDKGEGGRVQWGVGLGQVLWGQLKLSIEGGPAWDELDRDRDGKVSGAELADYYRRAGLGNVLVGVGRPATADKLTDALLAFLDTNQDGRVDEAEWKAAADTLRKLDPNDDEWIGPGELVAGIASPGTTGTRLLTAPASGATADPVTDGLPLVVLPNRRADAEWATVVVERTNNLFPSVKRGALLGL